MKPDDLLTWQLRMNLTATEACAQLGVSVPTWYRWLRGDSPIPKPVEKLVNQLMKGKHNA